MKSSKIVHEGLPSISTMKKVSNLEAFCYDGAMRNQKYIPVYKSLTIGLILFPALYGLIFSLLNINSDGGAGFYVLFVFILFVPGIMSLAFIIKAAVLIKRIRKQNF